MTNTTDVDEMEALLDERYPGSSSRDGVPAWDLYRRMQADWVLVVRPADEREEVTVHGDTLVEALRAGVEARPLRVVPRRPVFEAFRVERRQAGSRVEWDVVASHGVRIFTHKTRKKAQAMIERTRERTVAAAVEWDAKWIRYLADHVEGVDWRWNR